MGKHWASGLACKAVNCSHCPGALLLPKEVASSPRVMAGSQYKRDRGRGTLREDTWTLSVVCALWVLEDELAMVKVESR